MKKDNVAGFTSDFIRDDWSKGLMCINNANLEQYKKERDLRLQTQQQIERINNLEDKVDTILQILMEKKNGNA